MTHALRFTAEKIATRLDLIRGWVHRQTVPLPRFTLEVLDHACAPPGSGEDHGTLAWDSYWAGQDTHFVLRTEVTVPEGFASPALHLPLGIAGDIFTHPEALATLDGIPLGSADRYHHTLPLPTEMAGATPRALMLNGWSGLTGWPPDPNNPARVQMRPCAVVDLDEDLARFIVRAEVALDQARALTERDPRTRDRMLDALDNAFLALDTRCPGSVAFRASVPRAEAALTIGLEAAAPPLPDILYAVGHAHMDVAYLWPIGQIRQKNLRTSANVLRLMDRHPDYRFSHSQPQIYAYTQEDHPEIFDQIKARVAEGRWEVMGGMWVEPDCNVPSGESLVRQILLGRRYFAEQFGEEAEAPVLWLPDTFGFPWSLPQLMAQAGLKYFVSNKLNWNQYNRMPSSTTWWEGIDGTRVLTQFLTTPRDVQHLPFPTNYKSDLTAAEVMGTLNEATTGGERRGLPIAYGYGDGGGGPTEELIQRAKAYACLPGAPRMRMSTVAEAMAALTRNAEALPVWNGELYMEGHRGTLTTQAWIKRANRRAEETLHAAEAALVLAQPGGSPQPIRDQLQALWKRLCLNQFHDILTGTSVPQVFVEAKEDFHFISEVSETLLTETLDTLVQPDEGWSVFAPGPAETPGVILMPAAGYGQDVAGGSLASVAPMPAYGLTPVAFSPADDQVITRMIDGQIIFENKYIELKLSAIGELVSVWDKVESRDVLRPGAQGNQLWAFEDRPLSWDAWDIDVFFEDRAERLRPTEPAELVEKGPLRVSVAVRTWFGDCDIRQEIRLTAGSRRIDFVTDVDWHADHVLLKTAFPVNVHSPSARYEIQWGEIDRPTHRNTSWDKARFEVAGHRWADLSEADYGVALLNDCKYGYDIRDDVMRLTLIQSSTSPDPRADQGAHRFTYALLPHAADPGLVRTEARQLNTPVHVLPGRPKTVGTPLVHCDAPHVVLETVKPAEDGDGFILRLYEAERRRATVRLAFGCDMASVTQCDLLERDGTPLEIADNCVTLALTPFQIVSLRCRPFTPRG